MVETIFRTMMSVLETRPIYHQRDDTIRGYVFCSFLALALRQELQRHLAAKGWRIEWEHIVHDLDALHETTVTLEEHRYIVRSQAKRTVGKVFRACGVALPPALRSLPASGPSPPG
jgi:transposase